MAGSRLVLPSQQPVQSTGLPYPGGQLFFYLSGTTTPTDTYQDANLATPNSNPVILDSAGDAGNVFLDQSIVYKIVLLDAMGDLVWTFDPVYPFARGTLQGVPYAGVTTGSANTQFLSGLPTRFNGQTITFTAGYVNTMSATLNTGDGNIFFYQQGATGPALLAGNELQVGTTYEAVQISSLNDNAGGWQLIGAVSPIGIGGNPALLPFYQSTTIQQAYAALGGSFVCGGRLTLTSETPVLTGPVVAATDVIFAQYTSNQVPVWNIPVATWSLTTFGELTCTLSDATLSPAAAVANSLYDLFVWSNSGTLVLSRGPAWTNATTRLLTIARNNGVLVNSIAITNGPGAGVGVYVGTIATDSGGATVTFNINPAAAAGGPTGGAWLGLWNQFNRVLASFSVRDNTAGWTYGSATYRSANNSNNNRITYVSGEPEDGAIFSYTNLVNGAQGGIGVALDTTISFSVVQYSEGAAISICQSPTLYATPVTGQHFMQAVETSGSGTTSYAAVAGVMLLSGSMKY